MSLNTFLKRLHGEKAPEVAHSSEVCFPDVGSAIYNERDPFACGWIRGLVEQGLIPTGRVLERDIRDLKPEDLAGPGQRHLFAGIAGWGYAFRLAGIPDSASVWSASCPCQPFSDAGEKGGFNDDRHLWPTLFELIRECKPQFLVGEQVASPLAYKWLDLVHDDLEGAGYTVGAAILPAAGVGAPHGRHRIFFGAFRSVLADPCGDKRGAGGSSVKNGNRQEQPTGRSHDGKLDHADGHGCHQREHAGDVGRSAEAEPEYWGPDVGEGLGRAGSVSLVGNPGRSGLPLGERLRLLQRDALVTPERQATVGGGDADLLNPWRDSDYVSCRDGTFRPVISRSQLLAHGLPPGVAVLCPRGTFSQRAGLLRGFGNAIVPPLAAVFLRAFLASVQDLYFPPQ